MRLSLLNFTLEVVLEGRSHVLFLTQLEPGVDGEVHANGEVVLDSLVHMLFNLVADVLVLVGRTEDLVDLAVVAV